MDPALWLLPPIGAFIGWVTNVLAIRMLFHPREPVKIPFTPFSLQGVLPRRQAELADSIGRTVARDLLSLPELLQRLDVASVKAQLAVTVGELVERKLESGLSKFVPRGWRASLVAYVKDVVDREADELLDHVVEQFGRQAGEQLDVAGLVAEKVKRLRLDQLEELIVSLAGRELRAVIVLGGVLGFLMGIVQMVAVAVLTAFRG